jgi:hypothetical protein
VHEEGDASSAARQQTDFIHEIKAQSGDHAAGKYALYVFGRRVMRRI